MCNPPSKIIDAKISKRQEVQKEKHKRQKETHHSQDMLETGIVIVCQNPK